MDTIPFSWKTDDNTSINGNIYEPDADPKAVMVLIHGLGEHSGRYNEFFNYFQKVENS